MLFEDFATCLETTIPDSLVKGFVELRRSPLYLGEVSFSMSLNDDWGLKILFPCPRQVEIDETYYQYVISALDKLEDIIERSWGQGLTIREAYNDQSEGQKPYSIIPGAEHFLINVPDTIKSISMGWSSQPRGTPFVDAITDRNAQEPPNLLKFEPPDNYSPTVIDAINQLKAAIEKCFTGS